MMATRFRKHDGREFVSFNARAGASARMIWAMRAWHKALPRPIYTVCAWPEFKTAPRLLLALGFEPTCEREGERYVWGMYA